MDQRDVALTGLSALSGALTACGPFGGVLAFLGMSIGSLLALYGNSSNGSTPNLSPDEVKGILETQLMKQDVRDAWASISPTHSWHARWMNRAKSGEVFTVSDISSFDAEYLQYSGPNSGLRSGLAKLYDGHSNVDSTPGQYGVPWLILGVGLLIQLEQLGLSRISQRGEQVSPGEWKNFANELNFWYEGLRACDRLASYRVDEAVQKGLQNSTIKIGSPQLVALIDTLEVKYFGGTKANWPHPTLKAMMNIQDILRAMPRLT